ncbi:MAG TPA: thiamine pyrophosphate-binding protein [Eoetvoesiella sp.]
MSERITCTVGDAIADFLSHCGVQTAFGVISIHNMPILDAIAAQKKIRFVSARGEAGATNMADACARSTGTLGVVLTSTGTAAGNAAGAMVEALTAGTPLLHLTGQIEARFLDRDMAYIHEAPDQLSMLRAVSKGAFRVRCAQTALATVKQAVQLALTAPTGPVSVEIPIDIQQTVIDKSEDVSSLPIATFMPDDVAMRNLADALSKAKRPLLWLGGGARHAGEEVARLAQLGFGVITSTQGRGILAEDSPASLGAFTVQPAVEDFYQHCDAMLVVGSRLRGNETFNYKLKLPRALYRVDVDAGANGRCYPNDLFVHGDAKVVLGRLADCLEGRLQVASDFAGALLEARRQAEQSVRASLGPYTELVDELQKALGRNFNWVRDVTLSNSIWGNRLLQIFSPLAGVHALGGGIGQGMPMAIGSAIGATQAEIDRKTVCLAGDGGFILNLGELATAVQERANMVILLMNDQGYGVIRNIQDVHYGGRNHYVDLHTPDYSALAASIKLPHQRVSNLQDFPAVFSSALSTQGPFLLEVDMLSIGNFKTTFAGPPVRQKTAEAA